MLQKIAVAGLAAVLPLGTWLALAPVPADVRTATSGVASSVFDEPDPFPFGVCVTAKRVDPDPLCVVVDPDRA